MYGMSGQGSHIQKEYVESVLEYVYQNEMDYLKRLNMKADEKPTNYRGRRVPIETDANGSLAFGNPAGGDLATPGNPGLNHYLIPYVWMNLGLDFDYESILNSSNGMITDPFKNAVESTSRQMMKWLNIYASQGDGTTKLATASTAYAGGSPTIFVANGATDTIGATNIVPNMKVKIYDPTGTTQRVGVVGSGALTVSSVTKTQVTFGSNAPSDFIVGDILVPEGSTPSAGFHGVPSLVANTGTIFGVSRTAVPSTQSTVVGAGGGLSAALLYRTYLQVFQRTGKSGAKGKGTLELCYGITQQDAYFGLTTNTAQLLFPRDGQRRPNVDVGGADPDQFTFFGLKMNLFLDWLGSRIDFLNFAYMDIASLKKPGEMLAPFDKPLPAINGATNVYRAAQQQWWDVAQEFFTPAGHRHGALTGLTVTGLAMQKS
jgi:hypothetical protein